MKLLQGIFGLLYGAGFIGTGFLVLYVEWSYLRESLFAFLNPFLHVQVIITLLTMRLFWILLAATVLGYFAMAGAQMHIGGVAACGHSRETKRVMPEQHADSEQADDAFVRLTLDEKEAERERKVAELLRTQREGTAELQRESKKAA